MIDYIIPGWFVWMVGIFLTAFIPWAVWATIQIFRNDKVLALTSQSLQTTSEDVKKLDQKFDQKFDKLDAKLDVFLAQEFTLLKNFAQR